MDDINSETVLQPKVATPDGPGSCKKKEISTILNNILLQLSLFVTSAKFLLITGIFISIGIVIEGLLCFTLCQGLLYNFYSLFLYIIN